MPYMCSMLSRMSLSFAFKTNHREVTDRHCYTCGCGCWTYSVPHNPEHQSLFLVTLLICFTKLAQFWLPFPTSSFASLSLQRSDFHFRHLHRLAQKAMICHNRARFSKQKTTNNFQGHIHIKLGHSFFPVFKFCCWTNVISFLSHLGNKEHLHDCT